MSSCHHSRRRRCCSADQPQHTCSHCCITSSALMSPPAKGFVDNNSKESLFQLDEWLASVAETGGRDEERLQQLKQSLSEADQLLHHVDTVRNDFLNLKQLHEESYAKTIELWQLTESVRQEQYSLLVAREKISETMSHFDELEKMSKQFSNPSHLILNESLVGKLSRLDECMSFMRRKANYRESDEYLQKFAFFEMQVLLTIKNYVITAIHKTTKQVMPDPGQSLNPDDSVFSLFYVKFQANCHRIRSLVSLMEQRCATQAQAAELLQQCHEAYTSARDSLMSNVLTAAIEEMVQSHGQDTLSLIRNSSRMMMHVCRDEHRLYMQFFGEGCKSLDEFQEANCLKLYNALRPIVIHISDCDLLTRLCALIKDEVIDDFVSNHSAELKSFRSMMESLLEDMEERLIYLTT